MRQLVWIFLFVLPLAAGAQDDNEILKEGNTFYRQGDFQNAGEKYRSLVEKNSESYKGRYNLSLAQYKLGNADTAIAGFEKLAVLTDDQMLRAKSFYNKGAILSKENKLEESIEAYKAALRLNPGDNDARENLQKALLELNKRKQPPEKKDKKKEQQKKDPPRPKMNRKQEEDKLKQMQQKEQKTQQKVQNKPLSGGGMEKKDW